MCPTSKEIGEQFDGFDVATDMCPARLHFFG